MTCARSLALLGMTRISCQGVLESFCQSGLLVSERTLARNFLLQFHQTSEQRFGTRRATGDVNVHWDELIDPLKHGIRAVHAAGGSAGTHRYDPFRFRHLLVN